MVDIELVHSMRGLNEFTLAGRIGDYVYKVNPRMFYYLKSRYANFMNSKKYARRDPDVVGKINSVNIEMSIRCNLRCPFCWWWGEKGIGFDLVNRKDPMVTGELTTEQIKDVIDYTAKDRPSYSLSGGEPFIRPDTLDIIKYIDSKGLSVALTNNGTLLKDNTLQELARVRNMVIVFSLDGTKEVHDKIRGPGSFDKTISNMKKLIEYKGNSTYPVVRTNTTFSPWLVGHTKELIHILEDTGVNMLFFQHLWFTSKEKSDASKAFLNKVLGINDNGSDSHVISMPSQIYAKQLAEEIMDIQRTKFKIPIFIRPQMTEGQIVKYYTDLTFSIRRRCVTPWNDIIVKANGDVVFCPDEWITEYKLGNVKTDKIDDIWRGEKARKFREQLDKFGLFPACARCCAING